MECSCSQHTSHSPIPQQQLTLISSLPGSEIYICHSCEAFWMHEGESWELISQKKEPSEHTNSKLAVGWA